MTSSHFIMQKFLFSLFCLSFVSAVEAEKNVTDSSSPTFGPCSEEKICASLNPLSGKHLFVIPSQFPENLELVKDANGKIINVTGTGAVILEQLAISLNFTFQYYLGEGLLEFMANTNATNPDKINFFVQNEDADVMVGASTYLEKRNRVIDYPYNIQMSQMALMIPKLAAQKKNYLVAVWKPFQLPVWIGIIISLIIGVTSLYLISLGLSKIQMKTEHVGKGLSYSVISEKTRLQKALSFIFGLIVVQGSASSQALGRSRQLAILLLAGAWCLVCFVLVTAYSSVVISFLTAPETFKPIINSINDLPMKPEIKVTVNKGWAPDKIFGSAVGDDNSAKIFKLLGQELKQYPEQRCTIVDKCINEVRKGSSVYIFAESFIEHKIVEDWKKTGRCDFAIAKERFLLLPISGFILQKNSPYTQYFSLQLMRMEASGLLNYWTRRVNRARNCMKNDRPKGRNDDKKPLTLRGLSGAFVVLGFGYSLAIAVFIVELCHSLILNHRKINLSQSNHHSGKVSSAVASVITLNAKVAVLPVSNDDNSSTDGNDHQVVEEASQTVVTSIESRI